MGRLLAQRAGFVLVGGKSSRMGAEKALLPYKGFTLAGHVAAQVAAAAGSVTLVGSPEKFSQLGYPVLADLEPELGPLGGIHTALNSTAADWNLITACDLPNLTAAFLDELMQAAEASEAMALIPIGPDGQLQPLCAAYHRRAAPAIARAVRDRALKLLDAVGSLRLARWPVNRARWFANVNTPEEWTCHLSQLPGAARA